MPDRFRIRLTQQALDDLEKIHSYIVQDSPQSANRMIAQILDAIDALEFFPHRTVVEHQTTQLKYPVRSLPVKPYVNYFRVIDDERIVVIRHIRHGARQQPAHLDR